MKKSRSKEQELEKGKAPEPEGNAEAPAAPSSNPSSGSRGPHEEAAGAEVEAPAPLPSSGPRGLEPEAEAKPKAAPKAHHHDPERQRQPATKSPVEVLFLIAPPGCTFGISHLDHRFTSSFPLQADEFKGQMKQKTKSSYFGSRQSWKAALIAVHEFNWRKWHMVRKKLPLGPGQEEQVPGKIPEQILAQLEPHIQKLGPPKRY